MHVPYLNKMGADIIVKEQEATINGITPLKGEEVTATDLRAGATLIIAGLIAKGKTTIKTEKSWEQRTKSNASIAERSFSTARLRHSDFIRSASHAGARRMSKRKNRSAARHAFIF